MLRRSNRVCKSKVVVGTSSHEPPIKRKRGHHPEESDRDSSTFEDDSSGDEFLPTTSTDIKEPCALNLSESDSDSDAQISNKTEVNLSQQNDTDSEDESKICQTNFDFTALLNPQNATKLIECNIKPIDTVEEKLINDSNMDVAKILSVGEGVNLGTVLNDSENMEEKELKRDDNYAIPDMVEVTVKLPGNMKCKKGQDMQNLLRRRMNTICKDTQVLIHKVNLLLWISYGTRLNHVLNAPEVMGSALSLIPSEKAYPPKQCDLNYLENYIKWFSKKIKISSKTDPLCEITPLALVERFSKREAKTRYELIAMFISMLRSLGLNVRLVININAVSIKPSSEQLLGPLAEEDTMKPSSSKSKVDTKQKTPAKSEYFNKKSLKKSNSLSDSKKIKIKKSKSSEEIDRRVLSTDEEDEVFVKNNKSSKCEYFDTQPKKSQANLKKSKTVKDNDKSKNKKSKISEKIDRRVLSSDENDIATEKSETNSTKKVKNDFWVEVFLEMEEKWFCVDVLGQKLHCIKEIYVSCIIIIYYKIFYKLCCVVIK